MKRWTTKRRIKRAPKKVRAYGGRITLWNDGSGWSFQVHFPPRRPPRTLAHLGMPQFLVHGAYGHMLGGAESLSAARRAAVNCLKTRAEPPKRGGWKPVEPPTFTFSGPHDFEKW